MPPKKFFSKQKRNFSLSNNNMQQKSRVEVSALLVGNNTIGFDVPYRVISSDHQLKNLIKNCGGRWQHQQKLWVISKEDYSKNMNSLLQYCKSQQYFFSSVPKFAFKIIEAMPLELEVKVHKYNSSEIIQYSEVELYLEPESLPFYDKLYEFQRQSLKFGISKHGRVLLADEMGVGKTIQSLAIAYIYRSQWPLLIICPSTLRYNWQNQIFRWYGSEIKKSEVQVYTKGGVTLKQNTKILIISYELAWKFKDLIQGFRVAIADEAHYLKNSGCKRTDILVPLLAEKKRVILLTGTPAFARPRQIFNLASIIRPDVFNNFKEFGNRYCDPQRNPWSGQIEYNGCKSSKELFFLLKNRIMLRRLKKDVLSELPDKQRQKIIIESNKNMCKQINSLISSDSHTPSAQDMIMEMFGIQPSMDQSNKKETIMEAYRLSGLAKIQGVLEYISGLLQNDIKILVFAHHQVMLDAVEESLKKKKIKTVRIDGNVQMGQRQERVEKYQSDSSIKAALLSISAAGVGLTLTASNTVVFAQLHWTPGMMIQAQDRAHRIGQKDCVNCHYLIGENTLDPVLYNYLLKKVTNVSSFVDGEETNLCIEELNKGQQGKISKKNNAQSDRQKRTSERRNSQLCKIVPVKREYNIQIFQQRPKQLQFKHVSQQDISEWTDISSETKLENEDETASLKSRKRMIQMSEIQQDEKEHNDEKIYDKLDENSIDDTLRTTQILNRLSSGYGSNMKQKQQCHKSDSKRKADEVKHKKKSRDIDFV